MPEPPEGLATGEAIHPVTLTRPHLALALFAFVGLGLPVGTGLPVDASLPAGVRILAGIGPPYGLASVAHSGLPDGLGLTAVRRSLTAEAVAADGINGPKSSPFPWTLFGGAPASQSATQLPHPAVVRIIADEGQTQSQGSGSLIDVRDDCGLVITNWHVVRDATGTIMVYFPDGFASPARVRKVDRDWDLAALIIWRPNQAPIPMSAVAPRLGEPLTIAGYGSGAYRSAAGRCVQYVSPGMSFPPEMVEVSVEARQGDSGGPILNSRGELAGVLFGASRGSTTGSYCGRVRSFLTDVIPAAAGQSAAVATNNRANAAAVGATLLLPDPPGRSPSTAPTGPGSSVPGTAGAYGDTFSNSPSAGTNGANVAPSAVPVPIRAETFPDNRSSVTESRFGLPSNPEQPGADWSSQPAFRASGGGLPPRESAGTAPPFAPTRPASSTGPIRLDELLAFNGSPAEQAKTVLALIGLFTLVLQVWRFLGGESPATPPAAPPAGK